MPIVIRDQVLVGFREVDLESDNDLPVKPLDTASRGFPVRFSHRRVVVRGLRPQMVIQSHVSEVVTVTPLVRSRLGMFNRLRLGLDSKASYVTSGTSC